MGKVGAALNRMLGHVASALNVRQESETRVRQFVADASHELRTPLASIRGYAELAGRYAGQVPPDVSHAMRRIQSESTRMTSLVEELLLLARLDAGRPLAREPVDLSRLVVDAVSDARVTSRDHRWQLAIPGEPVTVLGDGQALHQVLLNLLGNARAHTPPGTTVVTGIHNGNPGEVVLEVADDGPGIPVELQPEVFERFARGDGSRSRSSGGTGLGLSIVAAIVTAHGGEVALDSRPGRPCSPSGSQLPHSDHTQAAQRSPRGWSHDNDDDPARGCPDGRRARKARLAPAGAGVAAAGHRRAVPVGPERVGLRQRLLRAGGAGRQPELGGAAVRLARSRQRHHRRQAAGRAVGDGAVGPGSSASARGVCLRRRHSKACCRSGCCTPPCVAGSVPAPVWPPARRWR
ncbi:hypothetical protein GCM10018954_049540 [Kutzneria kofuensis]